MADEFDLRLEKLTAAVIATIPDKERVKKITRDLGTSALNEWKRLAALELRSSARDYTLSLSLRTTDTTATVKLEGPQIVDLIENGMRGGDMRSWMLNGPRAKKGVHGRYIIIPFRHGGSGSSGKNTGVPMPPSIAQAVTKLKSTISKPNPGTALLAKGAQPGKVEYGDRLHAGTKGIDDEAKKILKTKKKSWHASSIYKGMIHQDKPYKKSTGSKNTTFRVLSENTIRGETDKAGKAMQHWYHPGIQAKHYALKVEKLVMAQAAHFVGAATK